MSPTTHITRTRAATETLLNALDEARAVLFENDKSGMATAVTDADTQSVFGQKLDDSETPASVPAVTATEFNAGIYSLAQIVAAADTHANGMLKLKR